MEPRIKSPLANPENNIISYFGPADSLESGYLIDPTTKGLENPLKPPFKPFITQVLYKVIKRAAESPTGHSDLSGIWADLITIFTYTAQRTPPKEPVIYFRFLVNGRKVYIKAGIEPMNARPDQDGYMIDESPAVIFSYIETE